MFNIVNSISEERAVIIVRGHVFLMEATDMGILIKTGDGRNTVYRYG